MDTLKSTFKQHALLYITLAAALLRFSTLTVESLWYDESFTAWLAGLSLPALVAATLGDVHPPTWYMIEWGMVHLLGNNEFALRLVSALAGVATVPAIYALTLAFDLGRRRALAAAALGSVAPFLVYYSQEARAYSLIFLLTTLATLAALKHRWGWLMITAAAAMYLHNLTVLYIAALAWLALYRARLDWRIQAKIILSFALVGIIWAPWAVWGLLGQVSDVSNGFWVRSPTLATPFYILTAWLWTSKATLFVLLTAPIFTLALIYGLKHTPRPIAWELLGLTLIPLGLCVIASLLLAPVLVERVIGSAAIPLYILIAPALIPTAWPRLTWDTAPRYGLAALFVATLASYYLVFYTTDRVGRYRWDYGLEPFKVAQRPTDGMFHANLGTYIVYSHYLTGMPHVVWQQANDLSQSLTDETKWAMAMDQAQFEDVACSAPRWWIAFYENPTTGDNERAEIDRIINRYGGELFITVVKTGLVNARIYLVEDPCQQLTAKPQ